MRKRTNVEVDAHYDLAGNVMPLRIQWRDGHRYQVDRVLDVTRAASIRVGGQGIRYTVEIGGRATYLYYEGPVWFVEERLSQEEESLCAEDTACTPTRSWPN